ncbi:MAG: integrase [Nitrospinae bacterium]|nr:integrase [Nitrospinota bacterium]
MTVMNEEVCDALKSVGVDDEKARRAAKSLTESDSRLNKLDTDVTLLKWMVGFNLALTAAILMKLTL